MKKKLSLSLLVSSVVIFLGYTYYIKTAFDYDTVQFVGYLFYWSVALFVVSLLALGINDKKYKIWLLITCIYVLFSLLLASAAGSGNGGIISFDGKDLTWILEGIYFIISIIYFLVQYFKKDKVLM